MQAFQHDYQVANPDFVVAGGVAANQTIRNGLEHISAENGFSFHAPPINLCTDNAVMIAWVAAEYRHAGLGRVFA
jgi:N6-L-threonylcarbamoyladenine synthase